MGVGRAGETRIGVFGAARSGDARPRMNGYFAASAGAVDMALRLLACCA